MKTKAAVGCAWGLLATWVGCCAAAGGMLPERAIRYAPRHVYPALRISEADRMSIDGRVGLGEPWETAATLYLDPMPAVVAKGRVSGGPRDLSASAQALWSDGILYVRVEVWDDNICAPHTESWEVWRNDGVEVFLDFDLEGDAGKAVYDRDDVQFVFSPVGWDGTGEGVEGMFACPQGYQGRQTNRFARTPEGYVFEASVEIPEAMREHWTEGAVVGVNIAVNDADPEDSEGVAWEAQARWFRFGKPSEDARARHRMALVATGEALDMPAYDGSRVMIGLSKDRFGAGEKADLWVFCGRMPAVAEVAVRLEHEQGGVLPVLSRMPVGPGRNRYPIPLPHLDARLPEDMLMHVQVAIDERVLQQATLWVTSGGEDYPGIGPSERSQVFGDRSREVVIRDLSVATPRDALSMRREPGKWRLIDYRIEEFAGRMVSATIESAAPVLEIPLGVSTGWHALSIGYWSNPVFAEGRGTAMRLRYPGRDRYAQVSVPGGTAGVLKEVFCDYVHLGEGATLGMGQTEGGVPAPVDLAFVRLAPLRPGEVRLLQAERTNGAHRTAIALNDGFSDFYTDSPRTAEAIEAWLEPYRHSDFKRLCWELGALGKAYYDSALTATFGEGVRVFPRTGDRRAAESYAELGGKGVNPLRVACERVHGFGMEFYVSQRIGAWTCGIPLEEVFGSHEYDAHPEWRCVARDGEPVTRWSYAFAGVRKWVINLFREAVGVGADGVQLLFVRGVPMVLYEEPAVAGFAETYGVDPRGLPEDDPRWVQWKADLVSVFMRELRAATRAWGEARGGRRVGVSVVVWGDEKTNLGFGIDLRTWVRERLVDAILPQTQPTTRESIDRRFFAALCRDTGVEWYCGVNPSVAPDRFRPYAMLMGRAFLDQAQWAYEEDAAGIFTWDTNGYDSRPALWYVLSRIGHRDALVSINPDDTGVAKHKLIECDGKWVAQYPPEWGY